MPSNLKIIFPKKHFIIIFSVTMFLIAGLFIQIFYSFYFIKDKFRVFLKVENLVGRILLLEETLSMSLRMYSETGKSKWEERYYYYEPLSVKAITKLNKTGPNIYKTFLTKETNEANNTLIEMEAKALSYIHNGYVEKAKNILRSNEYQEQKDIYSKGMKQFVLNVSDNVNQTIKNKKKILSISITLSIAIMAVLFFLWFSIIKIMRLWEKNLLLQNKKLTQASQELLEANKSLDQKIHKRTIDLQKMNQKLEEEIVERKKMESQLIQGQKLEAIGQLAAGIAHEINTPIQYISDNSDFIKTALQKLTPTLNELQTLPDLEKTKLKIDSKRLAYIIKEMPTAIEQTLEGAEQVSKIVRAMKEFSHPGGKEKGHADINKLLKTSITVSKNEWKYAAKIRTELDTNIPLVSCFPNEIGQVFLNLIINAAHAMENKKELGLIVIRTTSTTNHVEVQISDTGTGIPDEAQSKIFDPFFTTKEVGKGTGQGLALAYSIITKKHHGSIRFKTEQNKGTTFFIQLPILEGNK